MPKLKGNYCNVEGCHNRSESDGDINRSYYRLPSVIKNQGSDCEELTKERRRLWLAAINQNFDGKNLANIRVCSDHFVNKKKAATYEKDSPDWVPSVHMTTSSRKKEDFKSPAANDRYKRKVNRNQKVSAARSLLDFSNSFDEALDGITDPQENIVESGTASQTDVDKPLFEAMFDEIQSLRSENLEMKKEKSNISLKFKVDEFRGNDDKVRYYTGLPTFSVLFTLFRYLETNLPSKPTLDKFQLLILCLMRLRLNLPIQLLSYEFNVSPSSVTRYFSEVIDIMYIRMKPFVAWPDRDQLRKSMPMQFRKHFGTKVAVIIDCFEVFIERPSNLLARAKTWSSYKHHNTAKFLIGITPQGSVSFISKAWGGRASDKHVTQNSGFLSNILPGDLVLADRGFDISDTLGSVCAELCIPAFTKGKNQLSPLEVENTRKLANVRIHVERVIGNVRQKYTILSGTLPLEFLLCKNGECITQLDKVVHVCCGLVNLCPSVVDFD